MKKLLRLLGTISLTVITANSVVACEKTKLENNLLEEDENNNDLETWNKIQKETINDFLNLMKKENVVYEINDSTLYNIVSDTKEKEENIVLQGTEKNIINQIIQSIFQNINNKIKNNYSNYFYDNEPIKIVENTEKFNINYIDPKAYSIINEIPIDINDYKNVKAINLTYDLTIEITYKKIIKSFNQKFEFIFTTNKSFILNRISELVNYIKEKINEFHSDKNNQKFLYDNNQFKKDYFDIFLDDYNGRIINNFIKTKFIDFLKNKQKKDDKNFIFKINNNFLISKTNNESDNFNLWEKILLKNKKTTNKKNLKKNLLSNWLFDTNKHLKNNKNNFSNFYYDKNIIENEIKINSFYINLNAISIYGLQLKSEILDNKINFYISKQWIEERVKEFGNLIYEFFKFFNTVLNDDETITLKIDSKLFDIIKNSKDINQCKVFDLLMNEFKKNKKINGINYFVPSRPLAPYCKNLNLSVDDKNNKIFFNSSEDKWYIGFKYGSNIYFKNRLLYVPFGHYNDGTANFNIEKNN